MRRYVYSPMGHRELEKIRTARRSRAPGSGPRRDRGSHRVPPRGHEAASGGTRRRIRLDFGGLPDVEPASQKLRIEGAGLDPKEISGVMAFLDRSADAKSLLTATAERFRAWAARAGRSAISASCCAISKARSCPMAASPITPALRWLKSGATLNGRRRRFRTRSNASSKRIAKRGCCRKSSSRSAMSASWCR